MLSLLPAGGTGAEIGVWRGDFSRQILDTARPAHLHLIDPWRADDRPDHAGALYSTARGADMDALFRAVSERFADETASGRVTLHRATSAEAMPRLSNLDFVYIDGDHAYPAVRADLDLAFAAVRPGGLICLDDHAMGKWWGDGVIRAANAFLGTHADRLETRFCHGHQMVIARR